MLDVGHTTVVILDHFWSKEKPRRGKSRECLSIICNDEWKVEIGVSAGKRYDHGVFLVGAILL